MHTVSHAWLNILITDSIIQAISASRWQISVVPESAPLVVFENTCRLNQCLFLQFYSDTVTQQIPCSSVALVSFDSITYLSIFRERQVLGTGSWRHKFPCTVGCDKRTRCRYSESDVPYTTTYYAGNRNTGKQGTNVYCPMAYF